MNKTLEAGLVLVVASLIIMAVWLSSSLLVFPMDDSYIHMKDALNWATGHGLTFNINPPDRGISTSSFLYTLVLRGGEQAGVGVEWTARIVGIVAYLTTVFLVWCLAGLLLLGNDHRSAWKRVAGSLAVAFSGNLVWFSLSGMETMLIPALILGATLACIRRNFLFMGLCLGLATLTRVEGLIYTACFFGFLSRHYVLGGRSKLAWSPLCFALILAILPIACWMGYTHIRTGHLLPTTLKGKQISQARAAVKIASRIIGQDLLEDPDALPWWKPVIYPATTLLYWAGFVCGTAFLPWRIIPTHGDLAMIADGLSPFGIFTFVWMLALFFGIGIPRIWRWLTEPLSLSLTQVAFLALGMGTVLTNMAYNVMLPGPGTASRYQVMNHLVWWMVLGFGVWRLDGKWRRWRIPSAVMLAVVGVSGLCYWQSVYAADIRHMGQVRIPAAIWVRDHLPPAETVAAHDIGAVGFFGGHRVADLGGLTDPEFAGYLRSDRVGEWLEKQGVKYVVLPIKHSNETGGFYDYARSLGLIEKSGVELTLATPPFENDFQDWRLSAAATWNAVAGVGIYRIEYRSHGYE